MTNQKDNDSAETRIVHDDEMTSASHSNGPGSDDATVLNARGDAHSELPLPEAAEVSGRFTRGGAHRITDVGTRRGTTTGWDGGEAAAAWRATHRVIKDRFVLQDRLGKGGMGQVFRALDLRKQEAEDEDAYVAIKFLGEQFSSHPKALISLQREAKKTQQLAHPNILTVYDFDRDGAHVYMTMELLSGAPLSDWESINFAEGTRPTREKLIEDIAVGLVYAHGKDFVHSDLKPDNIFVTDDGRLKIVDFGIARMAESATTSDSFDAGQLGALTVRYASLEMLQRSAEPHPSDDIYALGVIAYQLYTGKHPFGGASAQDAWEQGLVPEPIPKLPRYRWRAIQGALQLERQHRTQSADEFLKVFTGAQRRRRVMLAGFLLLALSAGYFAYLSMQEEGPSVPFAQLPVETRQAVTRNLDMGQRSLDIQDWDGASRYYMEAYELHPRNPDAKAGLGEVLDVLDDRVSGATSQRQREFLLKLFDAYAEHAFFAENARFRRLHGELIAALE
ncbi:MAG: serine/threonine-protein kinase [Chromatocurvus sp.]